MRFLRTALPLVMAGWMALPAYGYSVLSHEALVDAMWDVQLRPYLLQRFPQATADDLRHAHGYAYGGAIIQDLGYYPRASKEFSDLLHYVRTGDFIATLLHDANDLNETAFALGALSHYVSDIEGHRTATNVAEPMLYPRLRKKFGNVITYEDNPAGHLKTEFGFDVLEVARGNFAPEGYHSFIGFDVARGLVERAFRETYGLEISDLFSDFDMAVKSCRATVSRTIPLATRVAWAGRKDEIMHALPSMTHRRFVYIMKRSSYEKEWGKRINEPNFMEKFLAWLLKFIPPIGPLDALRFKMPTPQVEQIFIASFDRSVSQYQTKVRESGAGEKLPLPDENFDVGKMTPAGQYRMTDDAYQYWVHKLAGKKYVGVNAPIREDILAFYHDLNAPFSTKKDAAKWRETLADLDGLKKQ